MNHLIKKIIRLGITISISDREAFVEKMSGIIERYRSDPEGSERWAKVILAWMEDMKDTMNYESAVENIILQNKFAEKKDIEELSNAITKLTDELKEIHKKEKDV